MTPKAQEYLSVAVRLANTNITETERSKIYDKLRTIKQSFDSADWDTLKTNRFANKAIVYLLNCENEKLPKETIVAAEL